MASFAVGNRLQFTDMNLLCVYLMHLDCMPGGHTTAVNTRLSKPATLRPLRCRSSGVHPASIRRVGCGLAAWPRTSTKGVRAKASRAWRSWCTDGRPNVDSQKPSACSNPLMASATQGKQAEQRLR